MRVERERGRGEGDRAGPRSCVFLGGARHAAHHRNVSTRPEIKCLSNDTHGGSQPSGLCKRMREERLSSSLARRKYVDRFTGHVRKTMRN